MSNAGVEEGARMCWPLLLPWDHIFFCTARVSAGSWCPIAINCTSLRLRGGDEIRRESGIVENFEGSNERQRQEGWFRVNNTCPSRPLILGQQSFPFPSCSIHLHARRFGHVYLKLKCLLRTSRDCKLSLMRKL
jgi:hypothetical protein